LAESGDRLDKEPQHLQAGKELREKVAFALVDDLLPGWKLARQFRHSFNDISDP
jgi:hypothetical protein